MASRQFLRRDQGLTALFRHADNHFISIVIAIPQIRIGKFDPCHDLELLLHPPAALDGIFQKPFQFIARYVFIREQQLDKSGHGFTHSNFIAFIEFSIQMEIFIEHMRKIHAPHSPGVFGQTVGDQTVFFRQQFRTHLGNFPARQIVMNSVEKGAVIVKFRWKRAEKMCDLEQILNGIVDVSHEYHGGIRVDHIPSTGKGTGGHVVLHDLDGVLIAEMHSCHFVEGNAVPVTDQTYAPGGHGIEQIRRGGLTAAHQNGIRGNFFVQVAFACAAGAELT